MLIQNIMFCEARDVLYMNNAKAGCSTIKQALLTRSALDSGIPIKEKTDPEAIHGINAAWSKAFGSIAPESTFSFSVVRNPFERSLSGFLDKICRPGILRNQFLLQNGLSNDVELSYLDFLKLLDQNDTLFDQHYRPQVSNLLVGLIDLTEIHYLENFSDTCQSIVDAIGGGVNFSARNTHATGANTKLRKHLNDEAEALVKKLYRDDFQVFGYSTNPDHCGEAPGGVIHLPAQSSLGYELLRILDTTASTTDNVDLDTISENFYKNSLLKKQKLDDDFKLEVIKRAGSEQENVRFAALNVITGDARSQFEQEFVLNALEEQVRMAPYFVYKRAQLAGLLIEMGIPDEANRVVDELKQTTWQDYLVRDLEQRLEAA